MKNDNFVTVYGNNSLTNDGMNTYIGNGMKFVKNKMETDEGLRKTVWNKVIEKRLLKKLKEILTLMKLI